MKLLVQKLGPQDHVAIVTYRETASLALPSIACSEENKAKIIQTIDSLAADGSTQGSAGLTQAYEEASRHFIKEGTNRVILTTDGDFNVGVTDQENLMRLITDKAKSKVFLTVLGVGEGNLKDSTLELLADKGNGQYAYLDNLSEARKVLVEQMGATLITIAKDVKIQVEFNPAEVGSYRLIGYENRILADKDFNDDKKDAGEIGAGHTVTALYEVVPIGVQVAKPAVDPLKYQKPRETAKPPKPNGPAYPEWKGELMTVKIRYKSPAGSMSQLLTFPVKDDPKAIRKASEDFRFASAVAEFGMLLRDSEHKGEATYDKVIDLAKAAKGTDEFGYRAEFITLVRNARELKAAN
jgi:secreted protein with Ig-like and vWFA domain